jgi:3-dehydroquinate dehydratase
MPDERGNFAGTQIERIKILQKFLEQGGDFVDLDFVRNAEELIPHLPAKKLNLSLHDFDTVPKNLEDIFLRMKKFSPKIYKFAVTTNTKKELDYFLSFVKNFPKKHNAIFTTMGTIGREGREQIEKLNASWGTFVALDARHRTAEGQRTLDEISLP